MYMSHGQSRMGMGLQRIHLELEAQGWTSDLIAGVVTGRLDVVGDGAGVVHSVGGVSASVG